MNGSRKTMRTALVGAVVILTLSACSPSGVSAPELSSAPEASPSSAATPSAAATVSIPENCDSVLSDATVRAALGDDAVAVPVTPHPEDTVAAEFTARNGLLCAWIIPNSEASLTVYIAERDTPSDAETIAQWQARGLTESPGLALDAFWSVQQDTMVGTFWEARALADGYELRLEIPASGVSVLEDLAQEAAHTVGYR